MPKSVSNEPRNGHERFGGASVCNNARYIKEDVYHLVLQHLAYGSSPGPRALLNRITYDAERWSGNCYRELHPPIVPKEMSSAQVGLARTPLPIAELSGVKQFTGRQ